MRSYSPTRREALAALAGAVPAARAWAAPASELCLLPASELAGMIRAKKVSAVEVMTAHLRQIERVNPKVNAIVTLVAEQAMAGAKAADAAQARGERLGPLHGLPMAHKDLVETKGIRTTFGSPLLKDNVPAKDAILIERMRRAGGITVGKTNTPEFGAGSQTFNPVFGATRNPYDLTKTCGGSSGGAAVALTCGMVPVADGSDMGGSLRNPAAFCNVVGLRTAPGRVPGAAWSQSWSPLSVLGPMGRTVSDVALLLSAIAGPDGRSPVSILEPGAGFARPLGRGFKGVKVAWSKGLGLPVEEPVRRAVAAQRRVFAELGCVVEEADPDLSAADEVFKTLRALTFEANYGDRLRANPKAFKDTIHWEVERGARLTGIEIGRAQRLHAQVWAGFQEFLGRYEYFVLPVTQVMPFDVTVPYPTEVAGVKMETYIDWMKSCYFISVTGNPAMSVPCGADAAGLPVGLQIVGRREAERSVLELAYAFEQATGFGKRRPAVALEG